MQSGAEAGAKPGALARARGTGQQGPGRRAPRETAGREPGRGPGTLLPGAEGALGGGGDRVAQVGEVCARDLGQAAQGVGGQRGLVGPAPVGDRGEERRVGLGQDQLPAETDAPFLTPVPNRGQPDEPALTADTLRCLAEVTGTDLADLCNTVTATAQRTFGPW